MAKTTITLPLELVQQIRAALSSTIDMNVTVQGLCRLGCDEEWQVCLDAIYACIEAEERRVCPAADELAQLLKEAGHA